MLQLAVPELQRYSLYSEQYSVEILNPSGSCQALTMCHDNYDTNHDHIAAGGGATSLALGPRRYADLLLEVLAPRLHPAPAFRLARPQDLPGDRLRRSDADTGALQRTAPRPRPGQGPALFDRLQSGPAAAKKGEPILLLVAATVRARHSGLIDEQPEVVIDATGLDSRHTSRFYFARAGKNLSAHLWTKLTVVCDTGSHFFTSATVSSGPSNDAPQFAPAIRKSAIAVSWDRLLGDAAFDSEENHRFRR